jgi:hypothetical protein
LASALARIGQKSPSVTLAPPYNPHRLAAAPPRGFVQQGLSALSLRSCSADQWLAVRMKPYSLAGTKDSSMSEGFSTPNPDIQPRRS